jgi:hypothetical protein
MMGGMPPEELFSAPGVPLIRELDFQFEALLQSDSSAGGVYDFKGVSSLIGLRIPGARVIKAQDV